MMRPAPPKQESPITCSSFNGFIFLCVDMCYDLRIAALTAIGSESQRITRRDERQDQPPISLIKGFNSHRDANHCGVGEEEGQRDRLLSLGSKAVGEPGFCEEPSQECRKCSQACNSEVSQKPHGAIVRN